MGVRGPGPNHPSVDAPLLWTPPFVQGKSFGRYIRRAACCHLAGIYIGVVALSLYGSSRTGSKSPICGRPPSVDAPLRARKIVWTVHTQSRVLPSGRHLHRCRRLEPVWEFADRVQITHLWTPPFCGRPPSCKENRLDG